MFLFCGVKMWTKKKTLDGVEFYQCGFSEIWYNYDIGRYAFYRYLYDKSQRKLVPIMLESFINLEDAKNYDYTLAEGFQ